MPYTIVRNDLLKVEADAIVLPSNSQLVIDGGVGALVASRSDLQKLQAAARELAPCPVGSAVTTPSFARNAQYYIHAVGPVWQGGSHDEGVLLAKTYQSVFAEVVKNQCSSVAMPLISAGTFGYPVQEAFDIAVQEIRSFIDSTDSIDVTLVVYDSEAFAAAAKRFEGIRSYIERSYSPVEKRASFDPYMPSMDYSFAPRESSFSSYTERGAFESSAPKSGAPRSAAPRARRAPAPSVEPMAAPKPAAAKPAAPKSTAKKRRTVLPSLPDLGSVFGKKDRDNLESWISSLDEGFSVTLCKLIDEKNLTDPEVYKRANMSRQLFSKIRSNPDYQPKKATAVALCVALELSMAETQDLLRRAGYVLSSSNLFDVIVSYHIENGIYDYFQINDALFAFDCPILGAK